MLLTFSGRRPSQDEAELRSFIDLLNGEGVRSYLEIGAREGDTFHEVMLGLPRGSRGVACDLPGGLWGKETTRAQLERAVKNLNKRGREASCIFGDSKAAATRRAIVGRGPYDAILIDGDHTLEGVTADWTSFGSLARIVAFHDIAGEGQAERGGAPVEVPALWASLRARHPCVAEFVTPDSHMGIGVVWTR